MPDVGATYADEQLARLEDRIREVYAEAQKDVQEKIDDFNRRYKIKEAIHEQELKDGKITKADLDAWKRGQVFQGKRWQAKLDSVTSSMHHANEIAVSMLNDAMPTVYAKNANYMAYTIEHGEKINFGFDIYDTATVVQLIRDDPKLLPEWKIDEPKDYTWNYRRVNNAITQGIIQGESLDKIAKRLATGLATQNFNHMRTFARTAMTEAQNAGRVDTMRRSKDLGIVVEKMWIAVGDERTRHAHMELDGQTKPVEEDFENELGTIAFPGDPNASIDNVFNCRCTLGYEHPMYSWSQWDGKDTVNGEFVGDMGYEEWEEAKRAPEPEERVLEFTQVGIGRATSVEEINELLNTPGLFKVRTKYLSRYYDHDLQKWAYVTEEQPSKANLTGCDLDAAKSIASAYEQIFSRFPQLKGKFDAPDAQPEGMEDNTYAWCYIKESGKVEVNPNKFNNWQSVIRQYERDVQLGWHPYGTTAESIVTHEVGHAIDGLLAKQGILGGNTKSGEFRYASSSLKTTIMNRAAKANWEIAQDMEIDKITKGNYAVKHNVSTYAAENPKEWFAECFAEYITSASPRTVAREFGKELERLVAEVK